jgi:hypothetical protein
VSLADYWDKPIGESGNWLDKGDWQVKVTNFRPFITPARTSGVEFKLENDQGATRATFWLTEPSMPRLASFAKACGLSKAEAANYDPMGVGNHSVLLNHQVNVRVVLDDKGKYHQVDTDGCGWWSLSDDAVAPVQQPAPPPAATVNDEDIPF